jgi:uncharacterized repeat protein (TIGR03833 family)
MPVTQHAQVKPGLTVSIVLKADQRSGRQVQGQVAQVLTRHNHPRGIKVKLTDGRVGRIEKILSTSQSQAHSLPRDFNMSANDNPWADASSQGAPHVSQQGAANSYYQGSDNNQGYQAPSGPPPQQPHHNNSAPSQGVHRSDTEELLARQGDRAEQVEHMQQYEANAHQTEDDRNQAQLQKEFPNIDSSLIAAIYNERKAGGDLGEVRELLQELNSS